MALITGTWTMSIEDTELVKEMIETGEYGIGGYPISEASMIEFFRNWVFGLDPNTYKDKWACNPVCHYHLSLSDEEGTILWQDNYEAKGDTNA